MISRRRFLKNTAVAVTTGFAGLSFNSNCSPKAVAKNIFGYGVLIPDPDGILDLPQGFTYSVLSRTGDKMDDGLLLPGAPDAMATFSAIDGKTILIRNHELSVDSREIGGFGNENDLINRIKKNRFL